jgi:hypothetical protein
MLHLKDLSSLYPLQNQQLPDVKKLLILNDLAHARGQRRRPESRVLQVLLLKDLATQRFTSAHDRQYSRCRICSCSRKK